MLAIKPLDSEKNPFEKKSIKRFEIQTIRPGISRESRKKTGKNEHEEAPCCEVLKAYQAVLIHVMVM